MSTNVSLNLANQISRKLFFLTGSCREAIALSSYCVDILIIIRENESLISN